MSVKERQATGGVSSNAHTSAVESSTREAAAILPNEERVNLENLLDRVREYAEKKARFVTITSMDLGGELELIYTFDQDLEMSHLRLVVGQNEAVPSISGIYLSAFLVENEMRELFGLNVQGLAIDYKGRMLLSVDGPGVPMLKRPRLS